MHACIRTCIRTCIHTYMHACMHACIHWHTYITARHAWAKVLLAASLAGFLRNTGKNNTPSNISIWTQYNNEIQVCCWHPSYMYIYIYIHICTSYIYIYIYRSHRASSSPSQRVEGPVWLHQIGTLAPGRAYINKSIIMYVCVYIYIYIYIIPTLD